jgi:bacterioferritin (cytochrome b1)
MLKDDRTLFRRIQELEGNPDLTKAEKDKLIEDIKNEIPEEEKPENITFSNTPGSN